MMWIDLNLRELG